MQRKVNVVKDLDGNKIVFIHDVRFKGKRSIEWTDVETYLKEFVGESYVIEDTNDMIYIGADFPDEYAHSEYSTSLKGANAKAKANAAQGVPELIEIATGKEYRENTKVKHSKDAKFGWYRYTSRFALLVYKERVLELDKDLETVALDEEGKKQFQERNLQRRKRATRKKGE